MLKTSRLSVNQAHFLAVARFHVGLDSILGDVPQSILRGVALGLGLNPFHNVIGQFLEELRAV